MGTSNGATTLDNSLVIFIKLNMSLEDPTMAVGHDLREMKMHIYKKNLYMNINSDLFIIAKILEATQIPFNK